jgi:hypothetical protein
MEHKACWLLNAVASRLNIGDHGFAGPREGTRRLCALEAALFMFGYDLVVPVGGGGLKVRMRQRSLEAGEIRA